MFASTGAFELFDYFRVPYTRVDDQSAGPGLASLWRGGNSASLSWPHEPGFADRCRPTRFFLGSAPLFGRVASDEDVRTWLRHIGGDWHPVEDIDDDQRVIGAVWRNEYGSVVLPFDPNELMRNFWNERYLDYARPAAVSRLAGAARRGYYRARPLLPRAVQMRMRRSFSRFQSNAQFPRWPVESTLHDFYDFLFALVAGLADQPVPYIGVWPGEWTWALVLTHDVEGQMGYDKLPELLRVEVEAGYRSSWNFVPQNRYVVDDQLVETLHAQGFEVGVHGFKHDGRDLASLATMKRRLPGIRASAERWQASGFRSPATLRSAELMPLLGFDYDSSYSDTAPFEPQPGGCCTWLPYMIDNLVELPITLAQDHTLFEILRYDDESMWLDKARYLRDRGGMALLITHPDYIHNPNLLRSYKRFLEAFSSDSTVWKALPREVNSWWRRRSDSSLRLVDGEWRVVGPAEGEARVDFVSHQLQTA
jgi:peptidoglycan/xylan/chitin deacetylase (PgdA/CDA1 family)